MNRVALTIAAAAVAAVLAGQSGAAKVKVHADHEKAFNFSQARTWAWSPESPGDIILARTPYDDPALVRERVQPVIFSTVNTELPKRGLKPASGAPDLTMRYYLLLTIGSSAQTLGQFLPATTSWGLPPFTSSTTSLQIMQQGSLVLDFSANGQVVWRGLAEAQIKMDLSLEQRAAIVRESVEEILKQYPPKR